MPLTDPQHPSHRFSGRVEDYVKFRPRYPAGLLDWLVEQIGLEPAWSVGDIGSGTGFLSELFLTFGNRVYGVEPNPEMRTAAERLFAGQPRFTSLAGTAEKLPFLMSSLDLIAVGQAFHWFDPERARREFFRVLKPPRHVVLVWNDRQGAGTPFMQQYNALTARLIEGDPKGKTVQTGEEAIHLFFGADGFLRGLFENRVTSDLEGLRGRLLSSSYAPQSDQPRYQATMNELEEVFRKTQVDGLVTFEYATRAYLGRLT